MFSRCADDIVGLLNMSSSNNICRYLEYKNNIEKIKYVPLVNDLDHHLMFNSYNLYGMTYNQQHIQETSQNIS